MKLADKTCESVEWWTPPEILEPVRQFFGGPIEFDPATHPSNPTRASRFLCAHGLEAKWPRSLKTFCNPPYGPTLLAWVEKIVKSAMFTDRPMVALLPGQRFETKVWQEVLLPASSLSAVVFIQGRVKFLRPDGTRAKSNPYGSMLYLFNVDDGERDRCAAAFRPLGYVQWWDQ